MHKTLMATRRLPVMVFFATLTACGGGGSSDTQIQETDPQSAPNDEQVQCDTASQTQWAYDAMRDFYLFADQVPTVDSQSFESADDLVRELRFDERDTFSNVSNANTSALFFEQGRTFGLGYRWRPDEQGSPRIADVLGDSPFGRAGIERGDIIVSVNGLAWDDPQLGEIWDTQVAGSPDNIVTSTWQFEKRDTGNIAEHRFTVAEYGIDTVLRDYFTHPSYPGKIGYLMLRSFLSTSEMEISEAADFFEQQGISELVLDLRYNGGGRVSIARQLASIIGGTSVAGLPIYNYQFNNRYSADNFTLNFFDDQTNAGLNRVVVLTTDRTASASEMVIAGLQPHMEVVTIGSRTTGKPYISYPYVRCDDRLNIIEAEGFNAAGNSVFGGIVPTCLAEDDVTRNFGINPVNDEVEGLLDAAIDHLVTGSCTMQLVATDANSGAARRAQDGNASSRQGISLPGGAVGSR